MIAPIPTLPRPDDWPHTRGAPWLRVRRDGLIELCDVTPEFAIAADVITELQNTGNLTISDDHLTYRFHMANGEWTYRVVGLIAGTSHLVLRMPD
ncbi:hypothetical protein [Gordonia rubripertincta]|uniref:hypothetical protein n=1 Tax=Gordonia rubripertincta TaxID=36822 RepID=UPI0015FE597F|nr:hypothetical protein [Gordonia rubripertincta]QMU22035.1 hypothetical protein H3V45_05970 [Gordonia rubripertincta]